MNDNFATLLNILIHRYPPLVFIIMSEPISIEVVLRIVNRQITEHLSWVDLHRLSRTSPQVRDVIINYCAPFEGDNVRILDNRSYSRALSKLTQLPVAARLTIGNMDLSRNAAIASAIDACRRRVTHISYTGEEFGDLLSRLSPAAAGRITSLDLCLYPEFPVKHLDGSHLTGLKRLSFGGQYVVCVAYSFLRSLPCPEQILGIRLANRDIVPEADLLQMGIINAKLIPRSLETYNYPEWRLPFHSRYDHILDEAVLQRFNPAPQIGTLDLTVEKGRVPQTEGKSDTYLKIRVTAAITGKRHRFSTSPVVQDTQEPVYDYRVKADKVCRHSSLIISIMAPQSDSKDVIIDQIIIFVDQVLNKNHNGVTQRYFFGVHNKYYIDVNLRFH